MPRDRCQTYSNSTFLCHGVSGGVCWCLLVCCVPWRCHGVVWGVSEGYLSGIHRNWRRSDVFGGYVGSQSLQYGAKTLFRHSPERHNFCRLTILRHSNIKMVAYKLSKNGWVMPFFVIFRLVREKLLVTVALDHPVIRTQNIHATISPVRTSFSWVKWVISGWTSGPHVGFPYEVVTKCDHRPSGGTCGE